MTIDISTPALLFPTVSLLLLAYTNRFVVLATLIRTLHAAYQNTPHDFIFKQIANLRHRVLMIRNMQAFGVLSLLCCVLTMLLLVSGFQAAAHVLFVLSLVLMTLSLGISVWEIQISVEALELQLKDLEDLPKEVSNP